MLPAKTAILAEFQFIRGIPLVLSRRIITLLALSASQSDDITHVIVLNIFAPE